MSVIGKKNFETVVFEVSYAKRKRIRDEMTVLRKGKIPLSQMA